MDYFSNHEKKVVGILVLALIGCALLRLFFVHFPPKLPTVSATKNANQTIQLININTADFKTLTALPGIGTTLAGRIMIYRNEHGVFKAVDDLLKVKGLTRRILRQFYFRITL